MSATPPLRKLEYVLAVARELHFGRAAERVHVVQSSISRQVREVEAEVGFEIFRRNNHLVDLTDAGRAFVLAVGDMMARFDAEFKRARDRSRLMARRHAALCLIGYSPFVPATLRHEIRSIRDMRFPLIHLQFRLASESEMDDSLGSGVFQAGVTFAPLERNHLQQIPLRTEPLCAVSVRGHSSNGSSVVRLAELRAHPLIVPFQSTRSLRCISGCTDSVSSPASRPTSWKRRPPRTKCLTWCKMESGRRSCRLGSVMKCHQPFTALPFTRWKRCRWSSSTGTEALQRQKRSLARSHIRFAMPI